MENQQQIYIQSAQVPGTLMLGGWFLEIEKHLCLIHYFLNFQIQVMKTNFPQRIKIVKRHLINHSGGKIWKAKIPEFFTRWKFLLIPISLRLV